jgi:general stress protein 26
MPNPDPQPELDARFSDPEASPTPWAAVRRVIEEAELFWISTVRADGRPHVTPLPTVWQEDTLYFCTGAAEQKGINLAKNAHCALTTGNNAWKVGLDVVVEGSARRIEDDALLGRLAGAWASKYHGDWQFDVRNGVFVQGDGHEALVFGVRPAKVLAFRKGDFAQTRYRFATR